MISGHQILMARTMLRLPARLLSELTGVPSMLILRAEASAEQVITQQQAEAVRGALEAAGATFTEDAEHGMELNRIGLCEGGSRRGVTSENDG